MYFPIRTNSTPFFVLILYKKVTAAGEGESCLQQFWKTQLLVDYCFCLKPEYICSFNSFCFNISQTVMLSGFLNERDWSKTYRNYIGKPIENWYTICFVLSLFYKRNKLYFLSVYQHNTPLGTLGKYSKSCSSQVGGGWFTNISSNTVPNNSSWFLFW